MRPIQRRRGYAVVAVSAAAHVAVFAVLAVYRPGLGPQRPEGGSPMVVILMPKAARPAVTPPLAVAPIRLHRPPAAAGSDSAVAPLTAPADPGPAPQPAAGDGRAVLRGLIGCAHPELADLDRGEREACAARLAANARSAPVLGLGLHARGERALAAANAHNEACRAYRAGGEQPPLLSGAC